MLHLIPMKFINDSYKLKRGGYSRLYKIFCQNCDSEICLYQKDGPGNLRRMYLDRILDAKVSTKRNELICEKGHVVGSKIIYEKENRQAFRLFVDSVTKKIVDSKKF